MKNIRSKIIIIICALFASFQSFAGSPESIWIGQKDNKKVIVFSYEPGCEKKSLEEKDSKSAAQKDNEEYCKVTKQFIEFLKTNPNNKAFLSLDYKVVNPSDPRKILYGLVENYNQGGNTDSAMKDLFAFIISAFNVDSGDEPFLNSHQVILPENYLDKLILPKEIKKYLLDKFNKRKEAVKNFLENPFFKLCMAYDETVIKKISYKLFRNLLNLKIKEKALAKSSKNHSSYPKPVMTDLERLFGDNAKTFLEKFIDDNEKLNLENLSNIFDEIYNLDKTRCELSYLVDLLNNLSTPKDPNQTQITVGYSNRLTAKTVTLLLKNYWGFEEVCNTSMQSPEKSGKTAIEPDELREILIEGIYPVSSTSVSSTSKLSSSSSSKLSSSSSPYSSSSSSPAPSSSSRSSISSESSSSSSSSLYSSSSSSDSKSSSSKIEDQTKCNYCNKDLKSSVSCNICGFKYCNDVCRKEDEVNHFKICVIRCIRKLFNLLKGCNEIREESTDEADIYAAFSIFNDFLNQNDDYFKLITNFFEKNPVGKLANEKLRDVRKCIIGMQRNYLDFYINKRKTFIDRATNIINKDFDHLLKTTSSIEDFSELLYKTKLLLRQIRNFDEGYYKEKIEILNVLREKLSLICENCCKVSTEGPFDVCFPCFAKGKRHYYCSEDCQKAAWKNHKKICAGKNLIFEKLQSIEQYINSLTTEDARNHESINLLLWWIKTKAFCIIAQQQIRIIDEYEYSSIGGLKETMLWRQQLLKKYIPLLENNKQKLSQYKEWLGLFDVNYENRKILYYFYRLVYNASGKNFIIKKNTLKPNALIRMLESTISETVVKLMKYSENRAEEEFNKMNMSEIPSSPIVETKAPVNCPENKGSKEQAICVAPEYGNKSDDEPYNPVTFFLHLNRDKSIIEQINIVKNKITEAKAFDINEFFKLLDDNTKKINILKWIAQRLKQLDIIKAIDLGKQFDLKAGIHIDQKIFPNRLIEINRGLTGIEINNLDLMPIIKQIQFDGAHSQILYALIYKYIFDNTKIEGYMHLMNPTIVINNIDQLANEAYAFIIIANRSLLKSDKCTDRDNSQSDAGENKSAKDKSSESSGSGAAQTAHISCLPAKSDEVD